MDRYFHVSFSHEQGFGSIQYISKKGVYPSLIELKKGCVNDGVAIILNIIEFNKHDFVDFIKGLPPRN